MQQLVVIGTASQCRLFQMIGAVGLIVNDIESYVKAHKYIEKNSKNIGGVMVCIRLDRFDIKAEVRLTKYTIPIIYLSLEKENLSKDSMSKLMETALGMKLNLKS